MTTESGYQLSSPLIIDMPERLSFPRRLAYRTLTLLFWMGWIYLWIPLVTLLGWVGGFAFFREQLFVQQGWQSFLDNLPTYSFVVFMLAGTLFFWALTNWYRFSNREGRKAVSHVSTQEQADQLLVSLNNLALWQKQKRMVVHHDEHGRILNVTD